MSRARKVAFYGVFTALAVILSYVETFVQLPIPGAKLGLANLVVLIFLYAYGFKSAFLVSMIRIIVVSVLFSGITSMIYSFAGGLTSLFFMFLGKKSKLFSIVGVSIIGGVFHNFAQLLIASMVIENISLMNYLPIMIFLGEITAIFIGVLSYYIIKYLAFYLK